MDTIKDKWKKNLFLKAWERCRLLSFRSKKSPKKLSLTKSKSWSSTTSTNHHLSGQEEVNTTNNKSNTKRKDKVQVAPLGCFSVYVGPEKQRFVINIKFASHPLFKMLLEDAELEYGFTNEGPILLPCEVDLFYKVLAEMDNCEDDIVTNPPSWRSPLALCSPSRRPTSAACSSIDCKTYSAYRLLGPSKLLKLNTL